MAKRTKHLVGDMYDFDGEDEAFAATITQAVVTPERIAMDWEEGGVLLHALLYSDDGFWYRGSYGDPRPDPNGVMTGWLFKSNTKQYLFWLDWHNKDTGYEGHRILFFTPPTAESDQGK